tara:strand:+ start:612 stop:1409 length:798 start_codon:yes stop_codon:yes gene_type:complete
MAFKMNKPSMTQGTAKYKAACDAMQINRDMDASSLPDGRAKSSAFQKGTYESAKKANPNLDKLIKTRSNSEKGSQEYTRAQNAINKAYGVSKRHTSDEVKSEFKEREAEKKNPKLMPAGEGVRSQESKDKRDNKIAQNTAKNTERTAGIEGDKKSERKARKASKKLAKAAEARESGNVKKAERKERKAAKKMEKASPAAKDKTMAYKYAKSIAKKKLNMVKGPNGEMVPDYVVDGKGANDMKAGMPKYKSDAQRMAVHASKEDKK